MNIRESNKAASILVLVIIFVATACGTLEVSTEPQVSGAAPSITDSDVSQPTPDQVVEETVSTAPTVATPNEETVATVEPAPSTTEPPVEENDQGESTEPLAKPSEITMLDETWFNYTNYQLGFSNNFPRTKIHYFGSCRWSEDNGDHSYRPDPSHVPVQIFEDGDTVYITSEYQHELGGETRETSADGGTRIFFSECLAIPEIVTPVDKPGQGEYNSYKRESWINRPKCPVTLLTIYRKNDLDETRS